jgi:uncharacterized membrane protein (UPF0127 family)
MLALALAFLTIGHVQCTDGTRGGAIEIRHEGNTLQVELASTPEQRGRGLSNRTSLRGNAGMLFVYEAPTRPSIWMHNTLIPLDIIWIDAHKRVNGVSANVQPEPGVAIGDLKRYRPQRVVLYVLELNAGTAARLGIKPGVQLEFSLP